MRRQTAIGSARPQAPTSSTGSKLFFSEDWIAVVVGFLAIATVLMVHHWKTVDLKNLVPSYRWTTDRQIAALTPKWIESVDAILRDAETRKQQELAGIARGLKDALGGGDRKAIEAAARRMAALGSKTIAGSLGHEIRNHAAAAGSRIFTRDNLSKVIVIGIGLVLLAAIGIALMRQPLGRFLLGLPVVVALAWLARFIAGNGPFVDWGVEYVIFALLLGLLISNTIGVPAWLRPAVQTELFIKTGLVVLGASLLFSEILQAGALGILQALLVVFVVWYACFWMCRKLRVDDEFGVMLSTAVSICGVSAAIAACGAIQGDKKKLSYVTSLVLIVAVPMMVVMPWVARATGMPELVAGAWLGGTLDTTASVVAAAAAVGDTAMKAGVVVKFSQNALIGVAAFALAAWWTVRGPKSADQRPNAAVVWQRFPKFVLGFIAASAVFSFLIPAEVLAGTRNMLGEFRTWWFALAFVCIGLEARFIELAATGRGRPAIAFMGAQLFNVCWTLLIAWLLFGGMLFSVPLAN